MKILFLSGWGSALPIAMNCLDFEHEVRYWIKDPGSEDVGDGFVTKVKDYKESVSWADLVITDYSGMGKMCDGLRAKGVPVLGGTVMTDALEVDRGLGQRLFKSAGMTILESKEFKTMEEAIAYVQENPNPYVIKISGKAQNDKTSTYVGQMDDGSDIIPVLEHMAEKMEKGIDGIEIQQKVDGLEVAVSGFFNGNKFIGPCQVNFEHKKLMSWSTQQGMGPNTGEMGTTAYWCEQDIPLFKKILAPMAKPLAAMGYCGDFDINCVWSDGKLYPLEMTNRFGWPALPMQVETLEENDLGEFFLALATGKDFDLEPTHPVSLCVVVGIPPLPYISDEIFEKYSKDMPIFFKSGFKPEGLYPGEAKCDEGGQWRVAGSEGVVGCVAVAAAGGYSINECREVAYGIADQVIVAGKMVRDDIGRTTAQAYDELMDAGLLECKEEASK